MIECVLGFLFDTNDRAVVLIEKQRPDWARYRLNGIGGHLEDGEVPADAMAREFKEETGLWLPPGVWRYFGKMECPGEWRVFLFETQVAVEQSLYDVVKTMTDEEVKVVPVKKVWLEPLVPSVHWMIPLALDRNKTAEIVKP